jgi:hypothetical protein
MSTSTWTGAVSSDWNDADNWSPAGIPGATSDVVIATGAPVASASIGTVNSITDSSDLSFESAGTNAVTTFVDNTGTLNVDDNAGAGGTILNVGGTLTNSHRLAIGNTALSASDTVTAASLDNTGSITLTGSSANQALLDVSGAAGFGTAGVLSGDVRLAGDSAIEFASGEITSLAAHAQLHLYGSDAFIEDSKALGSNSALAGLASIGAGAVLGLHNGAAVSTTGALVNDGTIRLDIGDGDGGSSLTLAGALTNSGDLVIGNNYLSASDEVTAASLDNKGSINLTGYSTNQALLDVNAAAGFGATGVLTGNVQLSGDSAIEFAGGQITSIANGAQLTLNGNDAFIEDSTALGSNSALIGLASIGAGASLALHDGAAVSTTGALVNDGNINVDSGIKGVGVNGGGGSSLTLAGALTNNGNLGIGDYNVFGSNTLTAESLSNSGGIYVLGGYTNQALLDVTTGVAGFGTPGTLTGTVMCTYDSAIEFASGQISTIAAGASLSLYLGDAFIEDSTKLGSNSALTGLADIAGSLSLYQGESVLTTGPLTVSGLLGVDDSSNFSGGSTLSVGGALTVTNTGTLEIGNGGEVQTHSVMATSFVNDGKVDLGANLTNALNVSGATTNNGSISIFANSTSEELAGPVIGKGSFSPSAANLLFDASVSPGQTINESGAGNFNGNALILKEAQSFAGTIRGFGTLDAIDAANFLLSGTTFDFVENSARTGGTLTLHDGSLTANILMMGKYSNSDFALAPDSGTGTLVKFV